MSGVLEVLRCGRRAVLIELDDPSEVLALHAQLRAAPPAGMEELVPAASTVLLRFDPRHTSFERLRQEVLDLRPASQGTVDHDRTVVVPVRYDGPDLALVATATGLTSGEVIARHARAEYTVAFCGFAPGFAYLTGLDPALSVPRRPNPRIVVPAGSVAVADTYTAIYPRSSPGGWQLLGNSEVTLWDIDREPPALLTPGTRVRFKVIT